LAPQAGGKIRTLLNAWGTSALGTSKAQIVMTTYLMLAGDKEKGLANASPFYLIQA